MLDNNDKLQLAREVFERSSLTVIVALGHVASAPEEGGVLAGVPQDLAVAPQSGGAPLGSVGGVKVGAAVVLHAFVGEGELALHLIIFAVSTI